MKTADPVYKQRALLEDLLADGTQKRKASLHGLSAGTRKSIQKIASQKGIAYAYNALLAALTAKGVIPEGEQLSHLQKLGCSLRVVYPAYYPGLVDD